MEPGSGGAGGTIEGAAPDAGAPALRDLALGVLAVGLLASLVSWWGGLGALHVTKAVLAATACIAVGLVVSRRSARVTRFSAADRITLARATLVVLVLAMIGEAPTPALVSLALLMACVAAALDAVDGAIARRAGRTTAFGARFDMETDALLILGLSVLAWTWDKAGAWVLLAGVARYLFVAGAAIAPFLRRPLPPSRRRQAACVVQVVTLLACIAPWMAPPASAVVAGCGLVTLAGSFAADVLWLHRRAHPPPRTGGHT